MKLHIGIEILELNVVAMDCNSGYSSSYLHKTCLKEWILACSSQI